MNFSNYADFRTKVQTLIDGDDISVSDLSANTLDLIISMGEQRLYREVRSSAMDAALSLTITANAATIPTDCLELRSVYISGEKPLEIIPYETYLTYLSGSTSEAQATYAAQVGETLVFWPAATGTLLGRYYKKFSDISSGITSNTLFSRHPDIFVYAALAESAPFIGDNKRLPIWEAKYAALVQAVNHEERRRSWNSSSLRVRVA